MTAQISIPHNVFTFKTDKSNLTSPQMRFLDDFAPRYFCALMKRENRSPQSTTPNGLDPAGAQGVRRILVAGHGDLNGSTSSNDRVAQARAHTVVDYVREGLRKCASGTETCTMRLPEACQGQERDVSDYAGLRLWSASAGNTAHCTDVVFGRTTDPTCEDPQKFSQREACDRRPMDCDTWKQGNAQYRNVSFMLELTGDDMTGMLLDVRALQLSVSDGSDLDPGLQSLAVKVAGRCGDDERAYHGCERYREECEGSTLEETTTLQATANTEVCDAYRRGQQSAVEPTPETEPDP